MAATVVTPEQRHARAVDLARKAYEMDGQEPATALRMAEEEVALKEAQQAEISAGNAKAEAAKPRAKSVIPSASEGPPQRAQAAQSEESSK